MCIARNDGCFFFLFRKHKNNGKIHNFDNNTYLGCEEGSSFLSHFNVSHRLFCWNDCLTVTTG